MRIDLKSKLLFDRFSDPLGVMVTGSIVPGLLDILKSYRLTDREAKVMEYLLEGWTSKNTAEALNITERTVKAHISAVYEKTGAANRVELINLFSAP